MNINYTCKVVSMEAVKAELQLHWDELSEDDKNEIMLAKEEVKQGKVVSAEQFFEELEM